MHFGIDFGVGNVIAPKQEKRKIPTQLDDFESPMVNTYSIETTIAEKLDATPGNINSKHLCRYFFACLTISIIRRILTVQLLIGGLANVRRQKA